MSCQFVAEVSSNHNRDLHRCLDFVDVSADIGCDAVKFQLFRIDQVFAPEILAKSPEHARRAHWELPPEFIGPLAERCQKRGIRFSCTPFGLDAMKQLAASVDFLKIASYEILYLDFIAASAATGKPLVLSTGIATIDEIAAAVKTARESSCNDLTLLHCVSSYPTPPEQANLAAMETLRQQFQCKVGWSDHTVSPAVIYRAVHQWDATMIEFHLDLEGKGAEFAAGHCWLPDQIGDVINNVKIGLNADGDGWKSPVEAELSEREWRADPSDGLRPLKSIRYSWKPVGK